MEGTANGLVGHDVILTIATRMGTFDKKVRIVSVEDGHIKLKGPSGMETTVPLKDHWMRVESIRAIP